MSSLRALSQKLLRKQVYVEIAEVPKNTAFKKRSVRFGIYTSCTDYTVIP